MTKIGAIRLHAHGGPDVLRWQEIDLPELGPDDVLVRNVAVGVNFIDIYHRTGAYPAKLPTGLGYEGAGTVEAVGDDVKDLKLGRRVAYATAPLGAYGEAHVVPRSRLVLLPDSVTYETAAAILLKGLTAQFLLRQTYRLTADDTILVHAAAGGVGLLLCQWAKHLGARVYGTVGSKAKAELVRDRGCDEVILYQQENVVDRVRDLTAGRGVNVVYDSVGATTFMSSLDCLALRGLMVSFGNASGPPPPLEVGVLAAKGSLFLTRPSLFHYIGAQESLAAAAQELFDVIKTGAIRVEIGQTFPLSQVAEAHRALEQRQTIGSTVLLIS